MCGGVVPTCIFTNGYPVINVSAFFSHCLCNHEQQIACQFSYPIHENCEETHQEVLAFLGHYLGKEASKKGQGQPAAVRQACSLLVSVVYWHGAEVEDSAWRGGGVAKDGMSFIQVSLNPI